MRRNCELDDQKSSFDNAECLKDKEAFELVKFSHFNLSSHHIVTLCLSLSNLICMSLQCKSGLFTPQILEKNCVEPLRRSLSYGETTVVDKIRDYDSPKLGSSAFDCRVCSSP